MHNPLRVPRTTSERPKVVPTHSFLHFWLRYVLRATTAGTFSTALPKVFWAWCALYILTWTCASRNNGVHYLDISTSKSGQNPSLFFCFWLGHVLHATTARTFSTSQLPKAVRTWGGFSFFTWKCALRHYGVQLFISHLARWLRTRCFSEPTFRTSGATNIGKTVNRDFPTFSCTCVFFLLILSPLIFSLLPFSSLTFPISAFPSVHTVGRLTSKFRSYDLKGIKDQRNILDHQQYALYMYGCARIYIYINVYIYKYICVCVCVSQSIHPSTDLSHNYLPTLPYCTRPHPPYLPSTVVCIELDAWTNIYKYKYINIKI